MALLAQHRVGHGPRPLVLLHGFLGAGRNLLSLARRLAARAPSLSVVAVDLTGHGASPPLTPEADLGTLAGDVLATARALGVGAPLALAGHSLGGRVALRAGLTEPASVGHVVLLDITPSPITGGESARLVDVLLAAPAAAASRDAFRAYFETKGLARPVVEWLLQNLRLDAEGYRWRIDRPALAALHGRGNTEDLWPAVEGPRPYTVACVRGAHSPYVGEADARRLEAAGCPVATLAGAGHFVHLDRPEALADAMLARLP